MLASSMNAMNIDRRLNGAGIPGCPAIIGVHVHRGGRAGTFGAEIKTAALGLERGEGGSARGAHECGALQRLEAQVMHAHAASADCR